MMSEDFGGDGTDADAQQDDHDGRLLGEDSGSNHNCDDGRAQDR
jgi:hypothetical protein